MNVIPLFAFGISLFLILHTYAIYPIILLILQKKYTIPINKKEIYPKLSLIIAAYNEEKNIRKKLINSISLEYPKNKLEIIVASDCSTDKTDNIVKEFERHGVVLARLPERRGKTAAQNSAVQLATGDILVFSDAPTIYREDCLLKLVRNFNDNAVGCVTGEIIYVNETDSKIGEGGSLYWKYESWLKQMESNLGSVLGAAGCIYAMRRALYTPFEEGYISDLVSPLKLILTGQSLDDDFLTPIRVYLTSKVRSVMEAEAIAYEATSRSTSEEIRMRSRVTTRAISGLLHMRRILNPFRYPKYSFQLFSHKIIRWLVPIFLIILYLSNLFILESPYFKFFFILQNVFYSLALFGALCSTFKLPKIKLLNIPYYFCVSNYALFLGIIKFALGKRDRLWTPIR